MGIAELAEREWYFMKRRIRDIKRSVDLLQTDENRYAKETLIDFIEQFYKIKPPTNKFTLVREYKKPGTGVFLDDNTIKGSIVVSKILGKSKKPIEDFYYISSNRTGELGEPLIFAVNLSKVTGINNFTEHDESWVMLLKRNLRKKSNKPGFLILENANWGKDIELFKELSPMMVEHFEFIDNSDLFYDVYKVGSSQRQPISKERPKKMTFTPILQPVPQPRSI